MSRRDRTLAQRRARFTREILADDPTISDADLAGAVEDAMADAEFDDYAELQEDIAMGRHPSCEDTPCLQSCDFWGTGEGAHHGVIG